ncbi:ATP-binding protein [Streptomyces sp. YH02]|uniref:ATP-binding protein n=1 Tax=Streptomyces sp. YH02 TaxID=3256999 RepID=UPI0037571F2D
MAKVWVSGLADGVELTGSSLARRALVGRRAELAALKAALTGHRLVTVSGAAGIGKSRLAVAAVADSSGGPWEAVVRVRWHEGVPLGPWAFTARVARALDTAARRSGGASSPDLVTAMRTLSGGELLLFLDDVDAVQAQCSGLVQSMLMTWPALRVLVTARRPLGLGNEYVVRLPPLRTASPPQSPASSPAARLLLAAGRSDSDSDSDSDSGGARHDPDAVARVCRLLEGNALAIELAAAQLTEMSAGELADRLQTGQCWLASPAPDLRRHRSLRASLGAVHALCDPSSRTVWRRTSVFAGAFTEQAATFVCESGGLPPEQVPVALAELAAIGVLMRQGESGAVREPRYRMARAANEFGRGRLSAAGESAATRDRHARHCRSVAAVAETLWNTGLQRQAAQLVHDEHDDLVSLLTTASHCSVNAETAVETALYLWFWWSAHDRASVGAARVLALLPHLSPTSLLMARGQWLAGWLLAAADPTTASHLLSLAWPAAVLAGDDALIGRIAHAHGRLAWQRGALSTAAGHYHEAAETIPDAAPGGPSPMVSLAALAVVQAHTSPARAALTAQKALARPAGQYDTWATALAQYARALADHRAGDNGRARHRALRALERLDTALDSPHAHSALSRLLRHIDGDTHQSSRTTVGRSLPGRGVAAAGRQGSDDVAPPATRVPGKLLDRADPLTDP